MAALTDADAASLCGVSTPSGPITAPPAAVASTPSGPITAPPAAVASPHPLDQSQRLLLLVHTLWTNHSASCCCSVSTPSGPITAPPAAVASPHPLDQSQRLLLDQSSQRLLLLSTPSGPITAPPAAVASTPSGPITHHSASCCVHTLLLLLL
uniref:Uncharacterized protein n=1 Tax=Knipowitschia caucasica TaxID=637954 RepID=A0AAV2M302_KNICA